VRKRGLRGGAETLVALRRGFVLPDVGFGCGHRSLAEMMASAIDAMLSFEFIDFSLIRR